MKQVEKCVKHPATATGMVETAEFVIPSAGRTKLSVRQVTRFLSLRGENVKSIHTDHYLECEISQAKFDNEW